jgi:hypothetical protein
MSEVDRTGMSLRAWVLAAGAIALVAAAWAWAGRSRAAVTPPQALAPAQPFPTRLAPEELSRSEAEHEVSPVEGGYRRDVERPKPVQNLAPAPATASEPAAEAAPGGPSSRRRDEKRTLPEIFHMPADPRSEAGEPVRPAVADPPRGTEPPLADGFAPFGRLVKCELVDTVDSVTARSEPIVGIVTQDLDWNGDVIIPAGTEVFSYARPEAVIDAAGVGRLVDDGEWTLVLPGRPDERNGRELILKARALDRRETVVSGRGRARSWGLDDGADGLIGYTLSTLDNREIKLFAAAAISGMTQGLAPLLERQEPASGVAGALGATQVAPTVGNALVGSLGTGAAEVMNQVASRIREEISKRGVYVRVPSGKEFYLFVEQTIDPRAAGVGLRLPAGRRPPG